MQKNKNNFKRKSLALAGMMALSSASVAAETNAATTESYISNPLFITLLLIIVVLAIMVAALSGALKNIISSDLFQEKIKRTKEKNSVSGKSAVLLVLFTFLSLSSSSQEIITRATQDDGIGGLDKFTFYFMVVIIAVELIVLGILFNTFKNILRSDTAESKPVVETQPKGKTILDKINNTVEIENEESIMLDHNYDGIRELDNNLPPWWKYGFYLTILIGVIYMINYHITKTAPLQAEEYTRSIKKAEREIAEYMKTSANNVDESTVKLLTERSDIEAGKEIFMAACAACHGKYGEGTVGPNLTDDYWIHSGGVKDIFKTIKYGWPDKGMKSWKEDYSPMQIAQLTSFIKTLKGTNPPKQKEKQGELYVEQETPADSTLIKTDSTKVLTSEVLKTAPEK